MASLLCSIPRAALGGIRTAKTKGQTLRVFFAQSIFINHLLHRRQAPGRRFAPGHILILARDDSSVENFSADRVGGQFGVEASLCRHLAIPQTRDGTPLTKPTHSSTRSFCPGPQRPVLRAATYLSGVVVNGDVYVQVPRNS